MNQENFVIPGLEYGPQLTAFENSLKEMDNRFKTDPYVLQVFRDAETTPSEMFYMLRDLDKSVTNMSEQERKIRETGLRKVLKVLNDSRYSTIIGTFQQETTKAPEPVSTIYRFIVLNAESIKNLLIRTINMYLEELNPKVCPTQPPCPACPTSTPCPACSCSCPAPPKNMMSGQMVLGISFVMLIVIILVWYFLIKK